MTGDEFLVLLTVITILGLLLSAIIWWIGTDILHELRYQNDLLRKQNKEL